MKKILQYEAGESFDLFLLIKRASKATATNGKPYLTMVLQDQSGEIEARLWDASKEALNDFIAGVIVQVQGEIQNYRGKKQIRIQYIKLKSDKEEIKIEDLLMVAPISKEELSTKINEALLEMKNDNLKKVTSYLLQKYKQSFLEFPAATKNHHEFFRGLAYHVVSMLAVGKAISSLYPSINRDLLYAGIILHDLGKVIELSGAVATSYTVEGNLLGHITLMCNEIVLAAKDLNIQGEEVLLLQHMVLSHHGRSEWGSPKPPLIREAEILHMIDNIDARINMIDRALEYVQPGEFSERVFPLEDRSFYKPKINE